MRYDLGMKHSLRIAQLFLSTRAIKRPLIATALALAFLIGSPRPAHATDKTLIQLQAQVQDLQDALARLQQTNDERWALTKNALDQHTDAMVKLAATLTTIQQQLAAVQDTSKNDQLGAQVQAVHDSVDEVKVRLARLEKQLNDIAAAQQTLQAQPAGGTSDNNGGGASGATPAAAAPAGQQPDATHQAAAYVPPVRDLYQSAYRDYTGGHYNLAQQEFAQIIQAYPKDDLAANSQYYLGEIAYHQHEFRDAAKDYDAVLQNYPGSTKSAAAQLHKGSALIQLGERAEGTRELRSVIQNYPQSPESAQARSMLNGMSTAATGKPSPAQNQ
jgi:tol-pal system protein YbgF